jgi:hypothetical protein
LCEWDSLEKKKKTFLYKKKDWPSLELGTRNIEHLPLVKSKNVQPPLHINLGLMTDFVKVNGSDRATV